MILVLSDDALAAALLGAMLETMGQTVRFRMPSETPAQALRRVKPKVCFIDCGDTKSCNEEILGNASMRGVAVILFGTRAELSQVGEITARHKVTTIPMPPDTDDVATALEQALQRAS